MAMIATPHTTILSNVSSVLLPCYPLGCVLSFTLLEPEVSCPPPRRMRATVAPVHTHVTFKQRASVSLKTNWFISHAPDLSSDSLWNPSQNDVIVFSHVLLHVLAISKSCAFSLVFILSAVPRIP